MLRDDLLRDNLPEPGYVEPLEPEVDGVVVHEGHVLEELPGAAAVERGELPHQVEREVDVSRGEWLAVGPPYVPTRGDPEHEVALAPLVSDGEPWHELRLHAVEHVKGFVYPREGRPPHGGGGSQRVEVADPGRMLLLRDDQHAGRCGRTLARASQEQSRREGGGQRGHRPAACDHEGIPYTRT